MGGQECRSSTHPCWPFSVVCGRWFGSETMAPARTLEVAAAAAAKRSEYFIVELGDKYEVREVVRERLE